MKQCIECKDDYSLVKINHQNRASIRFARKHLNGWSNTSFKSRNITFICFWLMTSKQSECHVLIRVYVIFQLHIEVHPFVSWNSIFTLLCAPLWSWPLVSCPATCLIFCVNPPFPEYLDWIVLDPNVQKQHKKRTSFKS